jgi:DNA-directed RNA polymerase specialized sigma24 family protein
MDIEKLAEAALAGDPRAKQEFSRRLGEQLRRRFRALSQDGDVADELAQKTLMVMLEKMADFEPRNGKAFMAWVHKIGRYEHFKWPQTLARAKEKQLAFAHGKVDQPPRNVSSLFMLAEFAELFDEALATLTEAQQRAVRAAFAEELGEEPEPYSRATLRRALALLRDRLAQRMATPRPSPSPA